MHTVIARLAFRWVTFFLVVALMAVLMAGALRNAHASARAAGEAERPLPVASQPAPHTGRYSG